MATKKTAAAAEQAMKPVEDAVAAGKETVEKAVKAGTEAATKGYAQAVATTQEQVEKAQKAAFKSYGDLVGLQKDNLDAVMTSSNIAVQGYQAIGKELMAFTQSTMEENAAAAQALFGVRNLREAVDLQTDFARKNFDKALAESAKLSEMSVKAANAAIAPLQSRVNVAVQTMLKPTAA